MTSSIWRHPMRTQLTSLTYSTALWCWFDAAMLLEGVYNRWARDWGDLVAKKIFYKKITYLDRDSSRTSLDICRLPRPELLIRTLSTRFRDRTPRYAHVSTILDRPNRPETAKILNSNWMHFIAFLENEPREFFLFSPKHLLSLRASE